MDFMKKRTSIIVSVVSLTACQQVMVNTPQATVYQSSISSDGTAVVVKLADGQQRVVSSGLPNYSAKIGQVTVQHGERSFAIQSTQPTLSTEGKVTGSAPFKPNAPEGAHWQLIKLNGQKVDSKQSKRPPYLRMVGGQMHGLTGCNVMSGIYHRDEQKMQFMRVQGTTNSCDYQPLERHFISALQALRFWRVTTDYHLQFLDEKSQVVAEFIALFP